MAKRKKIEKVKLNVKKTWEVGRGHPEHLPGAGEHQDSRTKRNRTRAEQKRRALEENE